LLRFTAPPDLVMATDWVSFNVIDAQKQDWARGWASLNWSLAESGKATPVHARCPGTARVTQGVQEG
jgi:hypothetical protein